MSNFAKTLIQFAFILATINIIGLWFAYGYQQQKVGGLQDDQSTLQERFLALESKGNSTSQIIMKDESPHVSTTSSTTQTTVDLSPLRKADQDLATRIAQIENAVKKLEQNQSPSTTSNTASQSAQEYIIYIGTGSSVDREWKNVTETIMSIDTTKYPKIVDVQLEAALSIIGGEARARLVNYETGAVIAGSEVMHNTSTTTWKTSQSFSLQDSQQTYVVQLKSSSGERVYLNGARLIITVE